MADLENGGVPADEGKENQNAGTPAESQDNLSGAGNSEGEKAGGETQTPEEKPKDTAAGETLLGKKDKADDEIDFRSIVPEGMAYDEERAKSFTALAKEAGLSNEQINSMAAYGMKYAQEVVDAVQTAYVQRIDEWGKQAEKEFGNEFSSVIAKAGSGIEALEKIEPNIRKALNETGAGNRVEIIRVMAKIGELTSEDTFRGFGSPSQGAANIYPKTNFNLY